MVAKGNLDRLRRSEGYLPTFRLQRLRSRLGVLSCRRRKISQAGLANREKRNVPSLSAVSDESSFRSVLIGKFSLSNEFHQVFVSSSRDLVRLLHLFDFLRSLVPSRLVKRFEEVFARRLRSVDLSRDGSRRFGEREVVNDSVEVSVLRRRRVEG